MRHLIRNELINPILRGCWLALLCMGACSPESGRQTPAPGFLTEDQIQEDWNVLLDKIEKDVPYPFANCEKETYEATKNAIRQGLSGSMHLHEVYRLFYRLVQSLRDAHFALYPGESSDSVLYFPYTVLVHNNRIYIDESFSEAQLLPSGTEIIAINAISADSILRTIQGIAPQTKAQHLFFEHRTEKVFHHRLYYLFGMQDAFVLTTRQAEFRVQGVPLPKFEAADTAQLQFKIDSGKAYLKVNDLIMSSEEQRTVFNNQLHSFFQEITQQSIPRLILDIRGNRGGSSVLAKDILDFIAPGAYTLALGTDYFHNGVTTYHKNEALHDPAASGKHRYRGRVILLSDVLTYSSAHMMQVGFHYFKMGTVIGNGSSESLHISGEIRKTILPNSKFELIAPTVNFRLPGYAETPDTRFVPDVQIDITLSDRLQKKDRMLEKAMEY